MAGDETDDQHDRKRDQILHVADREAQARRHKKEIEGRDIEQRGERRRAAAE
jgi:hypothetical protein